MPATHKFLSSKIPSETVRREIKFWNTKENTVRHCNTAITITNYTEDVSNRSQSQQAAVNTLVETLQSRMKSSAARLARSQPSNYMRKCICICVCSTSSILSPSRRLTSEMQPAICKDLIKSERPNAKTLITSIERVIT